MTTLPMHPYPQGHELTPIEQLTRYLCMYPHDLIDALVDEALPHLGR